MYLNSVGGSLIQKSIPWQLLWFLVCYLWKCLHRITLYCQTLWKYFCRSVWKSILFVGLIYLTVAHCTSTPAVLVLPQNITAIQNASCSLCFYILCLCICFFGPHGVLKRMGRWDPSSCQSKKMMISLLKTGKVLMFFIKAEILFFLLPVKWRGHNCKSSGAPSLVMLTAPLFTDSISHENFICFNSRGKPTKRNKRSSCFFHIFAVLKPLLKHVLLFVYLLIPLSLLLSMQVL